MAEDLIRYDVLAQEALRGLVRKVLTEVAQAGLPGRAPLLHHLQYPLSRRTHLLAARCGLSGRDDGRAAAPVLGPDGHRFGVRGRPFLQGRAGEAARAVPRDLQLRRPACELCAEVRRRGGAVCGGSRGRGRTPCHRSEARAGDNRRQDRQAQGRKAAAAKPAKEEAGKAAVVSLDAFRKKNG